MKKIQYQIVINVVSEDQYLTTWLANIVLFAVTSTYESSIFNG